MPLTILRRPVGAPLAKATNANQDATRRALDYLRSSYVKLSKNEASLDDSFKAFIGITSAHGRVINLHGLSDAIGKVDGPGNPGAIYRAALDEFVRTTGDVLIKKLMAEPDPLKHWKEIQEHWAYYLLDKDRGQQFAEAVSETVLPAFVKAETKGTRMSPQKLQQIADVEISPIIEHILTEQIVGATQAVAAWEGLPLPKKGGGAAWFEGGAGATHLAAEMLHVIAHEGSVLVELVVPELALVKFGLELAGIWKAEQEQEEWERKLEQQRHTEHKIKGALVDMYNEIYGSAYARRDVLGLLIAGRALKAGLNPEAPTKRKLDRFVREQVVGKDPPANLNEMKQQADAKLHEITREYLAQFGGE